MRRSRWITTRTRRGLTDDHHHNHDHECGVADDGAVHWWGVRRPVVVRGAAEQGPEHRVDGCRDGRRGRHDRVPAARVAGVRGGGRGRALADLAGDRQDHVGTRVAQQYAMHHPATTRSIVLDSVVPNTLQLGNIFARNLDDALALQFALCSKAPACKGKLGDPRIELDQLLTKLRAAPVEVSYRDATTGEQATSTLSADMLAGLVRMYAYMPAAGALLLDVAYDPWPSALASAWQGCAGTVVAGIEMLLYQGVEQVKLFVQAGGYGTLATEKQGDVINVMCDAIRVNRRNPHEQNMAG